MRLGSGPSRGALAGSASAARGPMFRGRIRLALSWRPAIQASSLSGPYISPVSCRGGACPPSLPSSGQRQDIPEAHGLATLRRCHARIRRQAVKMVETPYRRPRSQLRATQFGESLLEADEVGAGPRVASWHRAARAGVATLEVHLADAKAHRIVLILREQVIFPEGRHAFDFKRRAKAPPRFLDIDAGKPPGYRL